MGTSPADMDIDAQLGTPPQMTRAVAHIALPPFDAAAVARTGTTR
ncbi:MAG: hypothetical protein Q8S33_05630 [Myxococcales bacterium]|nr:hypothetical protein [Myxococcales bacterium]